MLPFACLTCLPSSHVLLPQPVSLHVPSSLLPSSPPPLSQVAFLAYLNYELPAEQDPEVVVGPGSICRRDLPAAANWYQMLDRFATLTRHPIAADLMLSFHLGLRSPEMPPEMSYHALADFWRKVQLPSAPRSEVDAACEAELSTLLDATGFRGRIGRAGRAELRLSVADFQRLLLCEANSACDPAKLALHQVVPPLFPRPRTA